MAAKRPEPWQKRLPDPKAIHEGLLRVVFGRDARSALAPHLSPSHRFVQSLVNDVAEGPRGLLQLTEAFRAAFREGSFQIDTQIAEPGKVYTRATCALHIAGPIGSVHTGARWVGARVLVFSRLTDGCLAETFVETSLYEVLFGMGAVHFDRSVLADPTPTE